MSVATILQIPASFFEKPVDTQILVQLVNQDIAESPDLLIINQDQTGIKIATVRQIIRQLTYKSYTQQRYVILWQAENSSLSAQNALLKTIEEPPEDTHIFLIVANLDKLLPTIQSRCIIQTISDEVSSHQSFQQDLGQHLQLLMAKQTTYSQCISLAETYKDRGEAITFVNQLLYAIHSHTDYPSSKLTKAAQLLLQAKQNLENNGNVRLVLEHCFFTIKKGCVV